MRAIQKCILPLLFSLTLAGCFENKPLNGIYKGQAEVSEITIVFLEKEKKEAAYQVKVVGLLSDEIGAARLPITYQDNYVIMKVDQLDYRYEITKDKKFLTCTGDCPNYPKEFSLQEVSDDNKVKEMYSSIMESVIKN